MSKLGADAVRPCYRYLSESLPDIRQYLDSDSQWDLFLFRDELPKRIESTQKIALVIKQQGSWTSPNIYNTARFPRLITEFWSDPTRDGKGFVVNASSARDRINDAHDYIDRFLHVVSGETMWWPNISHPKAQRVIASKRADELSFFPVPEARGMLSAVATYHLTLG